MAFISGISLLVPNYDVAIAYYCGDLGFDLIEDTDLDGDKRWVVVRPKGAAEASLILSLATSEAHIAQCGHQAGGKVFLFLTTEDFARDYQYFTDKGVTFTEPPRHEPYGTVAVFQDVFGNLWDLIEPKIRQ